jgi:AcrR family transcriptional regulator
MTLAGPKRRQVQTDEKALARADWIRAAIAMLAENSVGALRVDELAKRLGVTKGSFYWHFQSRDGLLKAVLETWKARMTHDIEAYIAHKSGTAASRLNQLLRIALTPRPDVPGGPLELTLRDWARRDPEVQKVIDEVDAERVAFLVRLYLDAGLDPDQARDSAIAHLALTIGLRMVLFDGTRENLEEKWRVSKAFLVPNAPLRPHDDAINADVG